MIAAIIAVACLLTTLTVLGIGLNIDSFKRSNPTNADFILAPFDLGSHFFNGH